jgi:PAS domain S-box-containing protein
MPPTLADRYPGSEAERLPPRYGTWLPTAFVIGALFALLLVPLGIQWRVNAVRAEIVDVAEPARLLIHRVNQALTEHEMAVLALAITRRIAWRTTAEAAASELDATLPALEAHLRKLGSGFEAELERLRELDAARRAGHRQLLQQPGWQDHFEQQQERYQATRAATFHLTQAIAQRQAELRTVVRDTIRLGTALTALLVLLALGAALVVARLSRALRGRLLEEQRLRQTAVSFYEASTEEEVLRQIADRGALDLGDAAYVERVEPNGRTVEVVAVSGEGTPPPGTRVAFPGSLSRQAVESGEVEIVADLALSDREIARSIAERHDTCSALAIPLRNGTEIYGALVVLRGVPEGFRKEDAEASRVFSVLASLSLRRALLLKTTREIARIARQAEERYRFLYEENPAMYFTVDRAGCVESLNEFGARELGYTLEELLGQPITRIIDPADRHEVAAYLERVLSAPGEARHCEFRKLRKDGSTLWVREVARAVPQPDGEVRLLLVCEDLTARKQLEIERERLLTGERQARGEAERRAREEAALREATASLTRAFTVQEVIQATAESALQATNADGAFVERIDTETDELEVVAVAGERGPPLGARAPFTGSVAEVAVQRASPVLITRLAEAERPLPDHIAQSCSDCSAIAVPMTDGGGAIGTLLLLRTREKRAFRADEVERAETFGQLASLAFRKVHLLSESERRREELQRVMESRARLMRGFSHDVKNPLGAADGFAALLEDGIYGPLSDKQRQSVTRMRASLQSALELIADLLELARAEAGRIEVRREPTDPRALMHEIGEEYRAAAEKKGHTFGVETPEETPLLKTDAARVRQIVGNLLSNAVKFTPQGGRIAARLLLRDGAEAGREGHWASFEVADTGPGISAEQLDTLFREFSRRDPRAGGGAGIGLSISRKIAEALGGEITVESEPGKGSSFALWLPCSTVSDTPLATRPPHARS